MNDWIPWATRRDGPSFKKYGDVNLRSGLVLHSVEGWLSGAFGELDKPERQASWHFTNALDGTLYQHYPLTASCWASGNYEANTRYVAMESEGHSNPNWASAGPLNEAQTATALRLIRELGFTQHGVNLFQHWEVATRWTPNAGGTSCPSGRYQPVFDALAQPEEEEMPDPRIDELWRRTGGDKGVDFDVLKLIDNQNTATMATLRALITNLRQLASELEVIAS